MKLREFITEAAGPKVGRKYQHIEDLIVSDGSHGGLHAIERLRHMGEEGGSIELKWDGMPVVYWGRDEQGNFGMFPKNAWQYLKSGKTETSSGASTVMRSPDDVKAFVMGTGSGDPKARQQFANQFASLWPYFEKISPKQGYLEGGLLFYPGNKPDGTSAMPIVNPETNTYDFTPNITTFHIPVDSELGKKIKQSKVMVAATGYFPTMGSSDEQRLPNAESLSVPGVIVQGTTYVQEPVPLDSKGLDAMEKFLTTNAKLIDNYLAPKPGLSNPGGELYTYMNKHLRTEGLLADFPDWARANLSPKKAETLLSDPEGLKATLGAVEGLSNQKNILINQLSQGLHGGIKQTKPEGYVQAHPGKQFNYDMPGQFIKTIDQTNWAPKESVVNEARGGKKAVVGWGRGMGHTGHDALVQAVIHQAENTGATPYFFVSRSFGKEDPIPPETKLAMYQKKFPKYAKMFSLPPEGATTLNAVLDNLKTKGYTDATIVVGETEKDAFNYLIKPDSTGNPAYKNFGWNNITVMSRQDTKAPGSDKSKPDYHEGPRATPMRQVLLDPNKTEQEQFTVWRQAMSPSLDDKEVLDMMNTAKQNLVQFHTRKPRRKASDIKEHIAKMRPLLKEASVEQKYKMLKLMKEAYKQTSEVVAENNLDKYKKYTRPVVKTEPKIERTTNPAGRTTDHVEWKVTSPTGEIHRYNSKKQAQEHFDSFGKQGVAENNTAAGINKMFNNLGDPVFSNLQRVALLAMQGRQQEAYGRLQSVIKDASPQVQKKIIDAVNNIKPVTINGKIADSSTIDKSKQHQDWIINTFIPWVQSLLGKQGVAEKMKMGATIEPMEDKEQSDPVVDATLKFYKPVMQKASEQEVDHYVEKAKHLLQKTDDPAVRKKLIDIFKEGQHNPYLQGGIITAIAALLGGGAINLANSIQLTPYQTNLMMQGILNTIVPTVGARMSGRNWVDTLKYTLASLGVGVGIATVMEKESDVIGHVAKDLIGKGAPIAKLRAARDSEQMKKRERSDGLPVEPKFDYLDEK